MSDIESDGFEAEDEWRDQQAKARANDHLRVGYTRTPFVSAGPPEGQVEVPCRDIGRNQSGCKGTVSLDRSNYDWLKTTGNDILARQGEPPVEDGEIARCWPCHEAWHARHLAQGLECDKKVGELVKSVKTGRDLAEHESRWLRQHGYSSTAEALEQIIARRAEGGEQKRGRRAAP